MYTALIVSSLISLVASANCPVPTSDCSVAAASQTGKICGQSGRVSTPSVLRAVCAVSSRDDCRTACLANTSCTSFSWDSSGGACTLYNKTPAQMGFTASTTSTVMFYSKACYTFTCSPANRGAAGANLGFDIGFGTAFDPTTNLNFNGVTSANPIRDDTYCDAGACKQVVFQSSGGLHRSVVQGLPVRNINGATRFFTAATFRRLYQVNSCTNRFIVQFYNQDGSLADAQVSEGQQIPWGTSTQYQFFAEAQTYDKVDVALEVVCSSQTDQVKVPTVFIDNFSTSIL